MKTTPKPKFKTCPKCEGLGWIHIDDDDPCTFCHGKGKIEVKPTKKNTIGVYYPSNFVVVPGVKPTKEKKCNHKWQIIDTNHTFNGGGGSTSLLAVCTKCLEKRNI